MEEEDDRDMRHLDPANLLPYERELEPTDPNVEKLPQQFQGSGRVLFGDGGVLTSRHF
jgi:hypothetical protein